MTKYNPSSTFTFIQNKEYGHRTSKSSDFVTNIDVNHLDQLQRNILLPNTHNTIPKIIRYVGYLYPNILSSSPHTTPENGTISSRPLTSLSTIKSLIILPLPLIRVSVSVPTQMYTPSKQNITHTIQSTSNSTTPTTIDISHSNRRYRPSRNKSIIRNS